MAIADTAHPFIPQVVRMLKLGAEDVALLSPTRLEDRTQFKKKHPALKRKGGTPPVDYDVAEMLIDLRAAYESGNLRQTILLYTRLHRILPV